MLMRERFQVERTLEESIHESKQVLTNFTSLDLREDSEERLGVSRILESQSNRNNKLVTYIAMQRDKIEETNENELSGSFPQHPCSCGRIGE